MLAVLTKFLLLSLKDTLYVSWKFYALYALECRSFVEECQFCFALSIFIFIFMFYDFLFSLLKFLTALRRFFFFRFLKSKCTWGGHAYLGLHTYAGGSKKLLYTPQAHFISITVSRLLLLLLLLFCLTNFVP